MNSTDQNNDDAELLNALDIGQDWNQFRDGPLKDFQKSQTLDLEIAFLTGAFSAMCTVLAILQSPHGDDDRAAKLGHAKTVLEMRLRNAKARLETETSGKN